MMSFENDQHDENHWLPRCYFQMIRSFGKIRGLEPSTQVGDSMGDDTLHYRRPLTTMEHPLIAAMWKPDMEYWIAGHYWFLTELIERNRLTLMKNWSL